MNLRQRQYPTRGRDELHAPPSPPPPPPTPEVYNIIPIHDLLSDHPSLRYPEVRAAAAALRDVIDLRKPPFITWDPHMDLLDWLGYFFGFQNDNVRNQREHLVLHLANAQMRLQPPPSSPGILEPNVLRRFRKKLLHNYTSWCSFLGRKSQISLSSRRDEKNLRRELLYVSLYLLIWDENTGRPFLPSITGDCAFLRYVVMPIYQTIKTEVESSRNGKAPHSAWRNYDDINEYFWSRRSFDKLWVLLILFLQASAIVAWVGTDYPWQALDSRDVQVELLTVFITWGGLRFLQSLLDAGTQYSLVSRETMWLGVRMVLKSLVALTWTVVFGIFYGRIWSQKNADGRWSYEANRRIIAFLEAVLVFVIPELMSIVLFVLPWIRNWIEELDWTILYLLTWWFHTRIFVGRGLREGLVNNFKYTVFWIVVLVSKFSFSYFFQIKPLVGPTKALLKLSKADYSWHEFFGSTNIVAVVLLWVPVILVYLMDLQIWYSIFSSIVGATIGLFSHLGEIRNIEQLRLRFQFFASAMQFNLMPEEQLLSPKATLVKKLRDAIHRFKLRYGLGQAYNKMESSQVEATRFALIWNEIILSFREEDLISDRELELLELPPNCWNIRVIRWPCVLLCNELLLALSEAVELADAPDRWPWLKICKNEYRRCAVIEAYDSIKSLLLLVVEYGTEENAIITTLFTEIENYMQIGKFTEDIQDDLNILQALYELSVREFPRVKRPTAQLRQEGLAPRSSATDSGLLFENAVMFPDAEDTFFYRQLRRLHTILSSRDSMHNVPVNIEARRRVAFFSNSLFMNMPRAPYVEKMLAFTVLTPYYDEEVVYGKEMLRKKAWRMMMKSGQKRQGISAFGHRTEARLYLVQSLDGPGLPPSKKLLRAESGVRLLFKGHEYGSAMMKFTYVVTCQVYGQQKAKGDARAEEILYLLKNNEALRVAYVDEVHFGRDLVEYHSVLCELGEGKPENQNHAIIFTRGDAVQTIDMNQDHYFEEALKMRNLLEEFNNYYGIRKPTILGVRENIFSGSVSSLAWFMSAQETSFVTLGQRVLANPLKVRMHYGHPDVFDRFWFLPRGGLSKASRVINISEDIFAGFNCTLRGGNVTHHEYIQVAKGRDVGLNQISMFEAKVASGNGEQVLSRDVYRLGHRLDFFRMLSFFYTSIGHYFNSMMVVLTVYTLLWGRLYLALSGVERAAKKSSNNVALGTILNQQFVIQLGLFSALPMIAENSLEHGFLSAVRDFLTMQLQLASFFYTFSLGTRAHFFAFPENYRLYARSHFVKAIELGVILIVYAFHSPLAKDAFVYIAMTITSWFLVVSWIMSPFIFNPSGFDWLKAVYDFDDFINWIWYRGVFTKADQSWETWWYEEQDHLRTTGLWGKLLEIILDLRFFFFQYGIVYQLRITGGNTSIAVYLLSWICIVVAVGIYIIIAYAQNKYAAKDHIYYRLVQLLVILLVVLVVVILLKFTKFQFLDFVTSLLAFIPTGWGLILIAQVLRPFLQSTVVWDTVVSLARLYDLLFGVIVMAPVALLSWLPGFQSMQTRILFNEAFSRGLQISRILTGKKSN
ncbi:Callose synthase [Melia azedarach]|uniref:Callose synthase n=1 Tax=Melia azedarach TaxID=155640 RepID=A0ACC1WX31_MELAZ|nr:Callose synthase [Melia azedarach]